MNYRQLFLLDGLGALVSAFFLGYVLVQWEAFFGMPREALYYLAGLAGLFALYSLTCYFLGPRPLRRYLRFIAGLNLLYCFLTLGLVIHHYPSLSFWGRAYFILEIGIILGLVYGELCFRERGQSKG